MISFDLHSTLAIATNSFYRLSLFAEKFFQFCDSYPTPSNISVSQIAMKKRVINEYHYFRIENFVLFPKVLVKPL